SPSCASATQSGQLAAQRSGTLVAERPDEQLAPNSPILSALPLYMAMRFCMDALRASTAFSLTWCLFLGAKPTQTSGIGEKIGDSIPRRPDKAEWYLSLGCLFRSEADGSTSRLR